MWSRLDVMCAHESGCVRLCVRGRAEVGTRGTRVFLSHSLIFETGSLTEPGPDTYGC